MSIYLGLDGGGTQTTCAVGNENSFLATGSAGGSNIIRLGKAQARTALHEAVHQACTTAGVDPRGVKQTCIGVAGAGRPEIAETVRRLLAEVVSGEITVIGDMVIALEAAFGSGPGIIVIAGTGSIAYGRDERGHTARAGGWGFAISDEGSGHWVGRSAISAILRAHDQGEETKLLAGILKAWRTSTIDELVRAANVSPSLEATAHDFSSLFPCVLAAAEAGDVSARSILTQAGAELAGLAKIVVRRLFPDAATVPVAMSGGVFRQSALVREVFYNSLRSLRSACPATTVNSSVIEPVRGALELARKAAAKGTAR